jgi:hypothetical protein
MSSGKFRTWPDGWMPRLAWIIFVVNVALFAVQVCIWGLPPSMLGSLTFVQSSVWIFCLTVAGMAALIAFVHPLSARNRSA